MGAAQSADQPPAGQAQPGAPQGPWKPDEFLAKRVERGRRLLAESEEHRGDADLQRFVGQMDASFALHRLVLDDAGQPRTDLSSTDRLQAVVLHLTASMHQLQSELWYSEIDPRLVEALQSLIDAVERAGIAAASWGLKILGVLAHIANAEIAIRSPSLPASERQELLQSSVGDLRGLLSDRRQLAAAAAEAERRQEAAGLASRLSATDLQRLCLLLHHRCIRHAVRAMAAVCGQGLHVPELQQWAQADVEQLIALEGSSTPSIYLRWRGRNAAELGLQRRAMADYEAALAACEASKSSLTEVGAAQCLANELVTGGGGPNWSLARVRGLLARSQRALALCKPWLLTPAVRMYRDMTAQIQAKADAIVAAHPGAGDSLPAAGSAAIVQPQAERTACAACGKASVQLKLCARCKSEAYCSVSCQTQHWKIHKKSCVPAHTRASSSSAQA